MSTTDRIIEMLYRMQEESTFEYNRISAVFPKKVYRFYYESLFKDHNRAVEKLASITGKHITESTSEILRRERVPRNYEEIKINQRLNLNSIMRDASLSMQRKLIEMVEKYKKELKENE